VNKSVVVASGTAQERNPLMPQERTLPGKEIIKPDLENSKFLKPPTIKNAKNKENVNVKNEEKKAP
jgi:hypothetical protein